MILLLVTLISSSLSESDKFLAPKPTPPNGECLETLEYCKVQSWVWLKKFICVDLVLEMCGSLPKALPFCNPDSPEYEGHDCMNCIVECYGETVGQGRNLKKYPLKNILEGWKFLISKKVFECGIDQGWVPPSDLSCLNHFAQGRIG